MSRIWTGWRLRLPSRQPLEIDPSKETMLNAPLTGKRILVTQSQDFMGPALCRLLAAQGADVVASTEDLSAPGVAERVVQSAGHIDVLVQALNRSLERRTQQVRQQLAEARQALAEITGQLPGPLQALSWPRALASHTISGRWSSHWRARAGSLTLAASAAAPAAVRLESSRGLCKRGPPRRADRLFVRPRRACQL